MSWDEAVNQLGKKFKHQGIQNLPTSYDILGIVIEVIEEHKSDEIKQF